MKAGNLVHMQVAIYWTFDFKFEKKTQVRFLQWLARAACIMGINHGMAEVYESEEIGRGVCFAFFKINVS